MWRNARYFAFLVAVVFFYFLWHTPRLTPANVARLQPGMTLEEVEAIVGKHVDPTGYIIAFIHVQEEERNDTKLESYPVLGRYSIVSKELWRETHYSVDDRLAYVVLWSRTSGGYFWLGSKQCLIAQFNNGSLDSFQLTATTVSGGPQVWLQDKYDQWTGKLPPIPPPPPPPPPIGPARSMGLPHH